MNPIRIKAHYDGERVQLDEPIQLPLNAKLIVTVIDSNSIPDATDWPTFGAENLARAYGEDEPEYTQEDLLS